MHASFYVLSVMHSPRFYVSASGPGLRIFNVSLHDCSYLCLFCIQFSAFYVYVLREWDIGSLLSNKHLININYSYIEKKNANRIEENAKKKELRVCNETRNVGWNNVVIIFVIRSQSFLLLLVHIWAEHWKQTQHCPSSDALAFFQAFCIILF